MINSKIKQTIGIIILALLVISPTFALASNGKEKKENERERERERIEVREENKSQSCFRAWGHLFAPGWIKLNGSVGSYENCVFPFGIGKKFKGSNSTTTPDTTAPVINNLFVTPKITSANIQWYTNEAGDSTVYFGTNSNIDVSSTSKTDSLFVKNHYLSITNLASNTTYYAMVVSKDKAGNTATSSIISFTTLTPIADTTSPTISNIIATIGTTTIDVGWKTNENATTKVYYSTSTPINITTSNFLENTSPSTNHSIVIYGLSTSTTYHLMIESKDVSNNAQRTDEFSVTTTSGI